MLPSSIHVMDVYTGPKGFPSEGTLLGTQLFIDSSTIDPQTSRTVFKAISGCKLKEDRGGGGTPAMLDAPVSGGVLSAEIGSLTFIVYLTIGWLINSHHTNLAGWWLRTSMYVFKAFASLDGHKHHLLWWSRKWGGSKDLQQFGLSCEYAWVSEAFALGQSQEISAHT